MEKLRKMSILKKSELKHITSEAIEERMKELNKELMKYDSQRAVGTAIENPGRIKEIRRSIAKLLTIRNNLMEVRNNKKV